MISKNERARMLQARSIGPAMINYLEAIGVAALDELADADAHELAFRINAQLMRPHINRAGLAALENLIALAKSEKKP